MEDSPAKMTDALLSIVWRTAFALGDPQRAFSVEVKPGPKGTTIVLRVGKKDLGAVIGKQGRIALSLRTILGAAGVKVHHRYALDIEEQSDDTSAI